jgi:hypothetical protein
MVIVAEKPGTTEACEDSRVRIVSLVISLLAHRRRPVNDRNCNRISRRAARQFAATAWQPLVVEIGPVADDVLPVSLENAPVRGRRLRIAKKVLAMLYTVAVVLLILWVLGLVSSYTLGGFIHILLVIAVVMILLNLINGRKSL